MQDQAQPLPELLRLLFVCAGPKDATCLSLEEEIHQITTWLKSGPFGDRIAIESVFGAKQNDLRLALLTHKPHILHFSGHGTDSGIVLENDSGTSYVFEFQQLAQLLTAFHDNLHMVVLNACNSSHRADTLLQSVDCVIGMNHKIIDRSAIAFAAALYVAVGFDRTIRECFISGKSALKDADIPQSHFPMLLSKDGFDPSRIRPSIWITPRPVEVEPDGKAAAAPAVQNTAGAIQLEITLLPASTNKARRWQYACNQEGEVFESIDEPRERLTAELMWQHLAAETNGLAKGFRGTRMPPPDVFLIVRDNLILNLYPERTLEKIICLVCQAATGTNVYIVCDPEVPFNVLYQEKEEHQTRLHRWFQTLISCGITDVIEIPKNQKSGRATEPAMLRKYANDSENRRRRLRKLVSAEDWAVELRPQAVSLKRFLDHFCEENLGLVNGKNLAVFYDLKPRSLSELLNQSQGRISTGNWFIGAYTGSKIDLTDLNRIWASANKKAPDSFDTVFEFNGMFEWLYAICRLHLAAELARFTSSNVAGKAMF
jgi:CHAT domain